MPGPRLGRPAGPRGHGARPAIAHNPVAERLGLWPVVTIAAFMATAGLIGLGFLAAPRVPAATPVVLQDSARIGQLPPAGPPLFTGSISIEPVEVTTASLRGPLFAGALPEGKVRPRVLAPEPTPSVAPLPAPIPQAALPLALSTALAPSPAAGLRIADGKPRVLPIEPVRVASLAPRPPGALTGQPAPALEPRPQKHTFIVAPGETLGAILERYGLKGREEVALIKALRKVFSPKDLRAGQEVTLTVVENPDGAVIPLSLTLETDFGDVAVSRKADGIYLAAIDRGSDGDAIHRRAVSRIQSSLYGEARAQNVPDSIIVRMMNTHSYDVDFQREIRPGDTFEMFYTNGRSDGVSPRTRGTLLYSSLTSAGKKRSYYRFTTRDGETDYYDENGVSSKKPLMRTPVDGARISSGFGMRVHPVLGYSKMHTGTDFAAPSGTPIYAAGDGRIDFAGRNGGYGNFIRLKHENGVQTAYAHMRNIAKGIKKGGRVRQGQVIGFVGSSGRTTGAHLHYEISINGKRRNPLKVKIAGGGRRLTGKDRDAFIAEMARIDALRQTIPAATLVAAKT